MMGGTPRTVGRMPVGTRLALMVVAEMLLVLGVRSLPAAALATGLVTGAYLIARIPLAHAWRTLRGVVFIAALVATLQLVVLPWERALLIAVVMILAVAIAALVTLTTSTTDLLDALERALQPMRPLGVDPERVALTIALTARTIPVIAGFGSRLRDSGRARGGRVGVVPYAVGLVVLTLQHAERVGEALRARGVDD
ncbi:energy-coupling factor transporter transmembrane protein EcfT [Nostocoides sp. F2B08]|uniref:CbiQ family ECF transporter T component n=1 Tax=Nostocoides sp. F2B08 TaxID=2653936 RepID=UPI0012639FD0|nr:CbiQ family ECF transporter T component [Tetrasphaera sp. F2B08]KAB7746123.1 energy-coupling factor transporter transmembrane protein EcfT [Tetrasphaera sp. F2B08]